MKLSNDKNNNYNVNCKRSFQPISIKKELICKSYDFAKAMVFGEGFHRKSRSGGEHSRKNGEIFSNTFQGKLAEFIVYSDLSKAGFSNIVQPDVRIHGKGIWDDADLVYKDKKINIKSCAHFSQLLLLEKKDWSDEAQYIPNLSNGACTNYDFFIMVRIKPDFKGLMQQKRWFYMNKIPMDELKDSIDEQNWTYDYGGVCTHKTIKHIIQNGYILPQRALLNSKTPMDATNYYIQCGDLKDIEYLFNELRNL